MPRKAAKPQEVEIKRPQIMEAVLKIVGSQPLVVHKFSEKSKKQILDKQQKKATNKKGQVRDPEEEWLAALYATGGGEVESASDLKEGSTGFTARALKSALVNAARFTDFPMTQVRPTVFVFNAEDEGEEIIPICGVTPHSREDTVRLESGVSNLRYRPQYDIGWYAEVKIKWNANIFSSEQIVNLLLLAGLHAGLCEMRPERGGQFGMFEVELDGE